MEVESSISVKSGSLFKKTDAGGLTLEVAGSSPINSSSEDKLGAVDEIAGSGEIAGSSPIRLSRNERSGAAEEISGL